LHSPKPIRLVLASSLFAYPNSEEQWYGAYAGALAIQAERALACSLGDPTSLIARSAQNDQLRSLWRFLAGLQLLQLDSTALDSAIAMWVDAQREMLLRLHQDLAALGQWLPDRSLSGKVVRIEANLSDLHDGARSTAMLTFESGERVVYKPRGIEIEDWYAQLTQWLNDGGAPVTFRSAAVLARDGYGWMQFVPHQRCQSQGELRDYYHNAGALLCVLHLLRATDCHFQNLIACGEYPVLVDAEMLFQPSLETLDSTIVTRTGLIPSFRFGPDGQTYDVSALGFLCPQITHFLVPEWGEGGVRFVFGRLVPDKNVPFAQKDQPRPQDYVEEMVDGFRLTYRFALRNREALLKRIEPAASLQIRYLVRETTEYYMAWNGDARAALILPDLQPSRTALSALRSEELAALRQFDIPRFTLAAASPSIHGAGNCFPRSGHELVITGIHELSNHDLEKQLQHLRLSWGFSQAAKSLA